MQGVPFLLMVTILLCNSTSIDKYKVLLLNITINLLPYSYMFQSTRSTFTTQYYIRQKNEENTTNLNARKILKIVLN